MRLLVMSCSKRKDEDPRPQEAWIMYDGPAYRMLRKYAARHGGSLPDLEVMIVYAKFGVIHYRKMILPYDDEMTPRKALAQRRSNWEALRERVAEAQPAEVFFFGGKHYRAAIEPTAMWCGASVPVTFASGGIGQQLSQLKAWLEIGADPNELVMMISRPHDGDDCGCFSPGPGNAAECGLRADERDPRTMRRLWGGDYDDEELCRCDCHAERAE